MEHDIINYLQSLIQGTDETTMKKQFPFLTQVDLPFVPVQVLFKQYQQYMLKHVNQTKHSYRTKQIAKDEMQEEYTQTELFDITNVCTSKDNIQVVIEWLSETKVKLEGYPDIVLPFANCFIKIYEKDQRSTIYVQEYSPTELFGHMQLYVNSTTFDIPFLLDQENKTLEIMAGCKHRLDLEYDLMTITQGTMDNRSIVGIIFSTLYHFNRLNTKKVLVDHLTKPEYYAFKNKPTVKINNRPIYYVLDKEVYEKKQYKINVVSKLELSHSFRVRGHWRKIKDTSFGKDRNGEYKIKGHTWVIDYIKGQGELVHKVRVIQ